MNAPTFRRLKSAAAAVALALASTLPAAAVDIKVVKSPGGIEAWLVEEHSVPLVTFNFAFAGGSSQDPAGKDGLANLMSTLLDEGAGDLKSEAFQEALEEKSIKISFDDTRDAFHGEMRTLAENRDAAVDLLTLALTKPRFDPEAVERMKRQAIAGVRRAAKDPESIVGDVFATTAFPGHAYGRPSRGTEASIEAIGPDDLKAWHKRVFTREKLKIAVVGAIDPATLARDLDRIFGALPAKGDLAPVAEIVPKSGARVDKAMAIPQTVVRFGLPGLKRADPDFIPAFVMNHILGGGSFSSWLYEEVREKRGLAYSVYTTLVPYDRAGLMMGGVGTRADRAEEAISIIRAEMKRMAETGPSESELAKAKSFIIGSYALRFDTSDKIAGQVLAIQMDALGIDYFDRRNALVAAVTMEDVRRAARRLLSNEPLIVTVGPNGS